ncbi:MAG: response regulator transcription factor [Clostridia bacterium]|nr:response regulator transcription factor [Clostridia bacterium]
MFQILVVECDHNFRNQMQTILSRHGYQVLNANDGIQALQLLEAHHADLILLNVSVPNVDGYTLTRTLRENNVDTPIIMISDRDSPEEKRLGFVSGTDDYMIRPLDEEELVLRIAALLRRSRIAADHRLLIGSTELNFNSLSISVDGKYEALPKKEFLVLFKLLSHPGRIFTRRQLMDDIWDLDTESDERTVDVHINRLRYRFRSSKDFEIQTVRGLGYKAVIGK